MVKVRQVTTNRWLTEKGEEEVVKLPYFVTRYILRIIVSIIKRVLELLNHVCLLFTH